MNKLVTVLKYLIAHAESEEAKCEYENALATLYKYYKYWSEHKSDCESELNELLAVNLGSISKASNYICYKLKCYNYQVDCKHCPNKSKCLGADYLKSLRF